MVRVSEQLKDYGPQPLVVNIEKATEINPNYRTAIWTGKYLQVTLMSINPGEDIGLEIHPMTDQFLRVEEGNGLVQMGETSNQLTYQQPVSAGFAIIVPASTWHNVVNTGSKPLKLYSIYAPPHHPHGTLQKTKAIAEMEEGSATHRPF
ncbi:MAG: cupin domain-containing protein [Sporolactobacillus sp.]